MDETDFPADTGTEGLLDMHLAQTVAGQNLALQRDLIQATAARLNISLLDCAAALLYLSRLQAVPQSPHADNPSREPIRTNYRFVRYRLDVGAQHQVVKEQLQTLLIEESGVDRKRIGKIDIRHNYTLVELPDGMPADIFQLLSEATIGGRKLAIKRIKPNRRNSKGQS